MGLFAQQVRGNYDYPSKPLEMWLLKVRNEMPT